MEIFKDICEFEERFEVSSYGRVFRKERTEVHPKNKHGKSHVFKISRKEKSQSLDKDGYLRISIKISGRAVSRHVHRLVAIAFLGDPPFEGAQVNHIDRNRLNNRADNLEWLTCKQNIRHSTKKLKLWQAEQIRNSSGTNFEISREFEVSESLVSAIKRGEVWT